jgi:magnesium transporter
MLTAYPASAGARESARLDRAPLDQACWIDLLDPTNDETVAVERALRVKLPSRANLSEVESSSRISEENGVLFLSMPLVPYARALDESPAPVGFVLSEAILVSIRYTPLHSVDAVAAKFSRSEAPQTSVETFAALIDEMVDVSADVLEAIAAELDAVSRSVFVHDRQDRRGVIRSNDALRDTLVDVGNAGERLSRIRGGILGLQRIVPFASEPDRPWIPAKIRTRLRSAQTDLVSLSDYEAHLSAKVQFLLDAVLGFISTRQNDIFSVLTIVSVVGIPPTLVAGIYGMNFKNMPELDWSYGYEFGLAMIALSTIVPILWFKWRGWL